LNTEFGYTYRDPITGFEGICVGKAQFMTGCDQSLLSPKIGSPSKDPAWYDDLRLVRVEDVARVGLPNEPEPEEKKGADISPAVRR
jgi:hypothetical protein